jgi:hypothetical protein
MQYTTEDKEEQELQEALRMSALDASSTASLLIEKIHQTTRLLCFSRTDKHFDETTLLDGKILQYDILNQFHPKYLALTAQHEGPGAICGFFSVTYAVLLERIIIERTDKTSLNVTQRELQEMIDMLKDMGNSDPLLEVAFQEIQAERRRFYTDPRELKKYLSQWVANYEVGDFLRRHSSKEANNTHFVRYNQFPMLSEATPDERVRLESERRFGGTREQNGKTNYEGSSSVYFIETDFFCKEEVFLSPEEWYARNRLFDTPQVCIIDLNGHFVAALACNLEKTGDLERTCGCFEEGSASQSEEREIRFEPSLIIFNTTATSYEKSPSVAWTFDAFHRQKRR